MIIHKTGRKEWINRHETFTQPIEDLYDLANDDTGNVLADYNSTTKGVQGIIQEAIAANRQLRVVGGEWSFTKIAASNGILLNSKALNLSFRINQNNLSPQTTLLPDDLYFAQCGISVKELNNRLAQKGRSLKTTGASNGQTIVGALSTGTHGAAIDVGAIPDFVKGLHIIVSPTRHVWLERASEPVVSDSFIQHLGATLLRNDEIFNAALVSFGSFGFIHGVMVETVPLFLYDAYRVKINIDAALSSLMETLDFANTTAGLPFGTERPYHFQVVVNPYDKNKQADVTIMYKRSYGPYSPPALGAGIAPGDDAPVFIGTLAQGMANLVPTLVNTLVGGSYKPYQNVFGTHGEMFSNSDTHGKVLSAAIGVPISEVPKMMQLLMDINEKEGPFAGLFAFRYVKGTKATLGFTRYDNTCIVELDTVMNDAAYYFYEKVWQAMEDQNIPHTCHWGKILHLDFDRLKKMYGHDNILAWMKARNDLFQDAASMKVFNNETLVNWGLDGVPMMA